MSRPAEAELIAALDALIERYGSAAHQAEIVRAREQFAARAGKFFEDDELYEARTAAFLEWYVCERPMDGAGAGTTPAALSARAEPAEPVWRALARGHRSLFSVEDLGEGRVLLEDLWGGALVEVAEPRKLAGVARGDLVEARLFGWRDAVRFGRTFLYHPAAAREAIAGHARRLRDEGATRADFVDFVAERRMRTLRYRHVAPEKVYS